MNGVHHQQSVLWHVSGFIWSENDVYVCWVLLSLLYGGLSFLMKNLMREISHLS
jgi:hypothetical protein